MAQQYGIRYFETSSKHNIGLDDAFEDVIEQAYKSKFLNQSPGSLQPNDDGRIIINGGTQVRRKKKCC